MSNTMIEEGNMSLCVNSPKEAMRVISAQMLKLRPKGEVSYRPYRKNEVYYDKHLDLRIIDLRALFPNAKAGDGVYIGTNILACCETDAKINFIGNAKVIYHDEVIFDSETDVDADGKCRCALHLKEGENPVLFYVRCTDENDFSFRFMPSVRWYWVWAKCYLLSARATSPVAEYRGEDGVGISRLYHKEEPFDNVYIYPKAPKWDNTIDFSKIFEGETGDFGYALTYALSDTELRLDTRADIKVFINKEPSGTPYMLKSGDEVLIKVARTEDFAFSFSGDVGLPMVTSHRGGGDKFLTLGLFREDAENVTPEEQIQWKKPYRSGERALFYKLAHKDDYLRPYLMTRFFGQWHYTFMVGSYGLLRAAETLSCEEYYNYFKEHMRVLVEYFDYMRYEHEHFSSPSFLDISSTLHDLDSIGSIGRNLAEYYFRTGDEDTLPVLDTMLRALETNIPRFPDGTFHRERDMWSDDTFMSCPFLVRMAKIKNDKRYAEEAIRQLLGFTRRLFIEKDELFSHIFFLEDEVASGIPWGRGNGWVFVSMADVLANAPHDLDGYEQLKEIFVRFAEGLKRVQDESGLWHQVLNRKDSYEETSCTALFSIGFCRGLRLGLLDESYKENIRLAYAGILREKVDEEGSVYGVCMGSGNAREAEYYMKLGTVDNDDHGTGVVLTMLCEVDALFGETL